MDIDALFERFTGAFAANTLRAYRADYVTFERWCVAQGVSPEHLSAVEFARFVDDMSALKTPATVRRYVDSLSSLRRLSGHSPVTQSPEVLLAMKRMHRCKGRGQAQAIPLTRDVLSALLAVCGNGLSGMRDQVLLHLGYETMRRRAELCQFRFEDRELRADGRGALRLRFSKADQMGRGKLIPLSPETNALLNSWAEKTTSSGYILRTQQTYSTGRRPMAPATVNHRLRDLQARAGLVLGGWLSGHSFRVGAALDMLEAGVSMEKIMLRGGWQSESTVMRYLRAWDYD